MLVAAIYFLFPAIVGLEDGLAKLDDGEQFWITIAVVFCVVMFLAQIAMFKGVVGGDVLRLSWSESYQINMASLAASRLFLVGRRQQFEHRHQRSLGKMQNLNIRFARPFGHRNWNGGRLQRCHCHAAG